MSRLLRFTTAVTATMTVLALGTTAPSTAQQSAGASGPAVRAASGDRDPGIDRARRAGWPVGPVGERPRVWHEGRSYPAPNPYLSFMPGHKKVDWQYWHRYIQQQSHRRAQRKTDREGGRLVEPMSYDELEPDQLLGGNDTPATAELISGFGTGTGEEQGVHVTGRLAKDRLTTRSISPTPEDDGAIPLARATGIGSGRSGISTTGTVGDGPHGAAGSGHGDFDYYEVKLPKGQQIVAVADATRTSDLQPLIAIWGKQGALRDFAFGQRGHAELTALLPGGTYYVMVTGNYSYPRSRFKSGSGTGAESEGKYKFRLGINTPDRDYFAVDLEAGDVLGGTLTGAGSLSVYDPTGQLVFGSGQDASYIYPFDTPLPGGGRATVDHVASVSGRYTVEVTDGASAYSADLEVYRAGLSDAGAGQRQTLFLDFDGERLNTNIFGGFGISQLSPLSAFLGRWGLTSADEDAVIDATVAAVEENIQSDLEERGLNDLVDVEVLNSRDDPDPFGQPNVSRVIVGGTIEESGVFTIGIAQSIDPGNFNQEETALLLLDELSGPRRNDYSINHWLTPASDRVAFVGQVLGNISAHEAGHFLGNWHVDQFDDDPNLMDQGGNFEALFGPGPDGVGGTDDDVDVDYGLNTLNPFEGFRGTEDTLNRTAFGLTGGS